MNTPAPGMIDLNGKTILVSGGSRDIGRAIVVELARAGADVAFTHHGTLPDATLEAAQEAGRRAFAFKADCTSQQDAAAFVTAAMAHFGGRPVYGLVNNAGGLVARKRLEEMDLNHWNTVMTLNATSAFLMTQAAVKHMADGGAIVNNASQAARDGGGGGASAYAASKGAMLAFTRAMAKELAPRKIRVNAVNPGLINTTFHDTFTKPEVRQKALTVIPLAHEGESADVARLVTFLMSPAAGYITGAAYDINGGLAFS